MGLVGNLARISLGAAAGVYAEKHGYVDRGAARIKDQYEIAAEAYGLPALSDASVHIPEVSMPVGIPELSSALPSAAQDVAARVAAGLAKARELVAEYVPLLGSADQVADYSASSGEGALARTEGMRQPIFSSTVGVVSLMFFAGAGTGAVVYYYYLGPEKAKAMAEERLAGAKAWAARAMKWADAQTKQTLKWVDARAASLGLKVYLDAVRAHLSALAVHANAIACHPQVLAAHAAAAGFATKTALPAARLALQTLSAHARSAYAAAVPHVLTGIEMAKPHVAAAQKAVQELIEVIVAYFK